MIHLLFQHLDIRDAFCGMMCTLFHEHGDRTERTEARSFRCSVQRMVLEERDDTPNDISM